MVRRNEKGLKKQQSYTKAPANLGEDRMKFIDALIFRYFSHDYKLNFHIEEDSLKSILKSDKHMFVISFTVFKRVLQMSL